MTWILKVLQHCSHNIDIQVLLDNVEGCDWYPVDAVYNTKNFIEVDLLPNKVGRWKVGEWYYQLNERNNWSRWSYDGERFTYSWSKREDKGNDFNKSKRLIDNEVKKFMDAIGIEDWGWRFLRIMPEDHMIWHIDSPNYTSCAINIMLKDSSPIIFENDKFEYKCALIDVSNKWHTVESGKRERLTFKIIPNAPYEEVRKRLDIAGFLL